MTPDPVTKNNGTVLKIPPNLSCFLPSHQVEIWLCDTSCLLLTFGAVQAGRHAGREAENLGITQPNQTALRGAEPKLEAQVQLS